MISQEDFDALLRAGSIFEASTHFKNMAAELAALRAREHEIMTRFVGPVLDASKAWMQLS